MALQAQTTGDPAVAPLPLAQQKPPVPGLPPAGLPLAPGGLQTANSSVAPMSPASPAPATGRLAPSPLTLASSAPPMAGAPSTTTPSSPNPTPLATSSGANPYANATLNTPGSATDLTNKTITPGAGVDRLALAKSNFENFRQSTEPEYQASLREANTAGFGDGQGGSGMLRGRLGDIGLARTRDLQTAATGNINTATEGSIADQYKNIGIAQQQQGFQQGQQGTAFNQADEQARLGNDLTNSAFGRAATTTQIGDQGNPADVGLALSGYYGNQAGQASAGAGSLIGNSVLANALKRNPSQYPTGSYS